MLSKDLLQADFSEKEAKVYLAILELGEGNIAEITQKSKLKRATVYLEIEALKNKGYVSLVRRKKRNIYMAENPKRIEDRLKEKTETINKLMPQLLSIANAMDHKPKVRYFEGVEGVKEAYKDTLQYKGTEILGWYSNDRIDYFDKSFILDYYMQKRIAQKIPMRMFAVQSTFMNSMNAKDPLHLRQMKIIKSDQFFFSAEINLYSKDKIAIIAHRENIALIIESKKIYDTLKSIFELMWLSQPNI
ncbi:MAG: helix-turn-helix domain-containing protein [Candidatus Moraniibacteriota bacterium]